VQQNKPTNTIMQLAQGLVASRNVTNHQNFLFWSLPSWKMKLMPEQKARQFEDRLTAECSFFEVNVLRREHNVRRKRLHGYANVQCTYAREKNLLHRWFVKSNMLLSLCIRCVRTSSDRQKQNLCVNAARICLQTCITFRNKIETKSNKLLQIVTMRHNTTPQRLNIPSPDI